MGESDRLLGALEEHSGSDSFRPQQRETIEHVLSGGDALVLMPTGGGKSLCYQLPAILSDGLAVVVSPLIALMHDQVTTLQRAGANAQYLNSTLAPMEERQVERLVAGGSVRLLYVAPERVNTDRFRDLLERRSPSLIAIDEAHCISEWGHEFRPDYRALRLLTERFVDVPTVACTATATPQVQGDIIEQLDRPRMRTFSTGFMRDNLTLRIVPKKKSIERLIARLHQKPGEAAIIYSQTRKSTEATAAKLRANGIKAEHYHGAMTGVARHEVQERFLMGETPVICATIAFGMGIDKADIRLVAHLDMPPSIESYYQEVGRAGRDGKPSECLLFYTKGVWHQQKYFIDQINDDDERQQRINRLRTMMNFCEQSQCRWSRMLQYFGERLKSAGCGHCDNCVGELSEEPMAETTRPIEPADAPSPAEIDPSRPLTLEEEELYEALRQWRRQLAKVEVLPDYMIASNKDLDALARARPATLTDLRAIKGFGPKKVENYGEALLQVIAEMFADETAPIEQPAVTELMTELPMPESEMTEPPISIQMQFDAPPDDVENERPPQAWQQRFNALAAWRTLTSGNEQCDPSDLLTFTAMRQIAEDTPSSISALAAVDGIGALAVERYAEELALILGIQIPSAALLTEDSLTASATRPSWQTSLELYQSGHTVLAIAERRMLSPGTVASHLLTAKKNGIDTDLSSALPPSEQVQAVERFLREHADASIAELHDQLEYRLSRAELQLVVGYLRPPEIEDD